MADPFTVLRGLFSAGMQGTEGARAYPGGSTGQFTPESPDISSMSSADFEAWTEGMLPGADLGTAKMVEHIKGMDPEEILKSEALWGEVRKQYEKGVKEKGEFKELRDVFYDLGNHALSTHHPDLSWNLDKYDAQKMADQAFDIWYHGGEGKEFSPSQDMIQYGMGYLTPEEHAALSRPFNVQEAVARHQAKVERPPSVLRAYHGTTEGPIGDYRTLEGTEPVKFNLPKHSSERGVFFTPDPSAASRYAGFSPHQPGPKSIATGSKVFPVDLDMSNSVTVDLEKLGIPEYQRHYDSRIVQTAIEHARQNNRDFVVIKGMEDIGGAPDQVIAVRPSGKVRSALTGETLFGMLAGLFGVGGPRRKNAQQGTQSQNSTNTQ